MMLRRAPLLFLGAALLAASPAHADSKAWAAAKKALPDGLQVVGGASFGKIKTSQLYQTLWPMVMAQAGDSQAKLAQFKTLCGVDAMAMFDSVVFGVDGAQQGAVVVALNGTTQKDFDACVQKIAKSDKKQVTLTKTGDVEKWTGLDKDRPDLYIRWLAKDVIAIATKADDKDLLTKMTSGGIAKDKVLATALGKIKSDAALWAVVNKQQDIPDINAKMTQAYGTADLGGGNISADLHVVVDSAKAATAAVANANQKLTDARKTATGQLGALIKALTVKADGSEIVVDAAVPEGDLLTLLGTFMGH